MVKTNEFHDLGATNCFTFLQKYACIMH